MTTTDVLTDALTAYREGDTEAAAGHAAKADSRLGTELATYLAGNTGGPVYDQPAAFTAFIRGGGNLELYRRLSAELARRYDDTRPESLLDLGCGDGLAVVPALELATHVPARIDLVEPSTALLDAASERLDALDVEVSTFDDDAQDFLMMDAASEWALTQSTFALQSIPPADRAEVLRTLRPRTGTLLLAEFDVPEYTEGSPEFLRSLVTRYERGIAEYGEQASLVAQGFLLPVLLGLVNAVNATAGRTNWEQPASAWVAELEEAGYAEVGVELLADYWWSPAVLITASS
ncbi:class I SAM-dependent methyltransferase [Amycolatopsis sp. H20-H5]|uniref:class I SAM-dependent methyltransferase n=1 Tax=Amycolatopsis sp. H20-H5 TaxID=3046309 RepID=UPI002DBCDA92|nr:class I SAM-dependent methyltransferase [Amycolatopsis sp. H20-H5]MEC3974639.1 class I SAM-dependent methyltransferase [Amycolatopsis sp. H20-H5]